MLFTRSPLLLRRSCTGAAAVTLTSWMVREKAATIPSQRLASALPRRFFSAEKTTKPATTATTPSTTPTKKKSFMEWYEGHLQARPIPTKMVTGSILWGLGDFVAQYGSAYSADTTLNYDFQRTGRAVLFGFALHAPASHLHFNFLEYMTVKSGLQGFRIPIFKAFMEQFVYWSWISNSMYHGCMGAMQGHSLEKIQTHISSVLWETQKAQWLFWIPIQLLNFQFIPVRHQLNVVLLTSVVWTALLSAWYPPEKKDDKTSEEEK